MPNSESIFSELTNVFRDVLNDDTLELSDTLTAAEVPEWDSFNHITIIAAVEARFGIKFKTAEMEQLRNVGEFVELIECKLEAKQA